MALKVTVCLPAPWAAICTIVATCRPNKPVNCASRVQVEHLANNLPFTVELDEIKEIRETMPSPVVRVNTDARACTDNVNRTDLRLNVLGRTVAVIPVKQSLNRPTEKIIAYIPINGRAIMEGWLHRSALSCAGSLDVVLEGLRDGIDFVDICWLGHG